MPQSITTNTSNGQQINCLTIDQSVKKIVHQLINDNNIASVSSVSALYI